MDGEVIKSKLREMKISVSEVARRMGVAQQNLASCLNAKDVKSGVIEDIAAAVGTSPSFFYSSGDVTNSAVANNSPHATVTNKTEGLTAVRVLERQLEIKDAQIDKLIDIIRTQK